MLSKVHQKRLLYVARALREDPDPENFTMYGETLCVGERSDSSYDSDRSLEHFGINHEEAEKLFGAQGCGGARTSKAAARYIERFVARKARAK